MPKFKELREERDLQTSIDSAKLKKEMPEIAEKYSKTSTVSGYVKITLREA